MAFNKKIANISNLYIVCALFIFLLIGNKALAMTFDNQNAIFQTGYTGQLGTLHIVVGDISTSPMGDTVNYPTTGIVVGSTVDGNNFNTIGEYSCNPDCSTSSFDIILSNSHVWTGNLFDVYGTGNSLASTGQGFYKLYYIETVANGGGSPIEIANSSYTFMNNPPQSTQSTSTYLSLDDTVPKVSNTFVVFLTKLFEQVWPFILAFAIVASFGMALSKFINKIAK